MQSVIKLGGSLLQSNQLDEWLTLIIEHANSTTIIVPGGGCFADFIRHRQKELQFDDCSAHYMAILAMEQYAYFLQQRYPELIPCYASSIEDFNAIDSVHPLLWMPYTLLRKESTLQQSWDFSSDSIALWLAETIKAKTLFLIKSTNLGIINWSFNELVKKKVIDKHFSYRCNTVNPSIYCLESSDKHLLQQYLNSSQFTGY